MAVGGCNACKAKTLLKQIGELKMSEAPELPPVIEAADDVMKTAADPSPANMLADIELAMSLVSKLKEALSSAHPSIWMFVKGLF